MLTKMIDNGYIIGIGEGIAGEEIAEAEYEEILAVIQTKPTAPNGYSYRLRASDLSWELVKLPPEPEPELSAEEVLDILLGGGVA